MIGLTEWQNFEKLQQGWDNAVFWIWDFVVKRSRRLYSWLTPTAFRWLRKKKRKHPEQLQLQPLQFNPSEKLIQGSTCSYIPLPCDEFPSCFFPGATFVSLTRLGQNQPITTRNMRRYMATGRTGDTGTSTPGNTWPCSVSMGFRECVAFKCIQFHMCENMGFQEKLLKSHTGAEVLFICSCSHSTK